MRVKHRYKFMEEFSAEVKASEGGLFFARSPVDGPIFETRQEAENPEENTTAAPHSARSADPPLLRMEFFRRVHGSR
jgi:hypothetical protein